MFGYMKETKYRHVFFSSDFLILASQISNNVENKRFTVLAIFWFRFFSAKKQISILFKELRIRRAFTFKLWYFRRRKRSSFFRSGFNLWHFFLFNAHSVEQFVSSVYHEDICQNHSLIFINQCRFWCLSSFSFQIEIHHIWAPGLVIK